MCKFSAKADSIYMMKLTKTFLKTSVIFWSHLTQIFKTGEVEEEKKNHTKQTITKPGEIQSCCCSQVGSK